MMMIVKKAKTKKVELSGFENKSKQVRSALELTGQSGKVHNGVHLQLLCVYQRVGQRQAALCVGIDHLQQARTISELLTPNCNHHIF